jgi:hypothetical protein
MISIDDLLREDARRWHAQLAEHATESPPDADGADHTAKVVDLPLWTPSLPKRHRRLAWIAAAAVCALAAGVVGVVVDISGGNGTSNTPIAQPLARTTGPSSNMHSHAVSYISDQEANDRATKDIAALNDTLESVPTFGGVRIIDSGIEISYIGSSPKPVSESMSEVPVPYPSVPITYRKVHYSWQALLRLTKTLDANRKKLDAIGIHLASWGPDEPSNKVTVRLQKSTDAAISYLQSHFGAAGDLVIKNGSYGVNPVRRNR